mmetsp:Transcript_8895/g.30980  ORF Transcript_8895/g.30980 Transcript_8895/m.30980 type:complete len:254 (-) Transcript_8895:892-1653(-)
MAAVMAGRRTAALGSRRSTARPAAAPLSRRAASPLPSATAPRAAAAADVGPGGLSKADPSAWITGLTPNKTGVRLAVAAAMVFAAAKSGAAGPQCSYMVHITCLATWFGTMAYTTFVAGLAMFKNLPRQTFRDVQEVLFPRYFATCALMGTVMLATGGYTAVAAPSNQMLALAIGVACAMLNVLVLEPNTSTVMRERAALEKMSPAEAPDKQERLKALGKQFGKWHGLSSIFNLGMLVAATGHMWWLVTKLVV